MSESLTKQVTGAAIWSIGARMFVRASGLVSLMILARILEPDDFGVVGLAVALIAAFEAMSDLSLQAPLVRHPDPQREHYDTVWTLNLLRGLLIGAIALALAEPMAGFFEEPRLVLVVQGIALWQVIQGLQNPGVADFQREFDFGKDFLLLAARKFASVLVAGSLALTILPDYRALICGILAGGAAMVLASFVLSPYRPRPSLAAFGELFGFSKWMLASNILLFAHQRADAFVLGKLLGMGAVGIQSLAMELANLIASEFAMPLRRAVMPGFAKLQDDPAAMRSAFGRAYGMAMLLALPAALGIGCVAEPLIYLAFGGAWLVAAAPLKLLIFYGLARASVAMCWPVFIAAGDPRGLVGPQLISLAVGLPMLVFGAQSFGLLGAAGAMALMAFVYALLVAHKVLRLIDGDALLMLRWMPRALAAALAMVLSVQAVLVAIGPIGSPAQAAGALICAMAVGGAVYPAALLGIWRVIGRPDGPESGLLTLLMPMIGRLAGRAQPR